MHRMVVKVPSIETLYHYCGLPLARSSNREIYSFATLPSKFLVTLGFRRAEGMINESKVIYSLWKENKEKLKAYVEGDIHDSLLIAEKLLLEAY